MTGDICLPDAPEKNFGSEFGNAGRLHRPVGIKPGVHPVDHSEPEHRRGRPHYDLKVGTQFCKKILHDFDEPPLNSDHDRALLLREPLQFVQEHALARRGAGIEPHEGQGQFGELLGWRDRSRGNVLCGVEQGADVAMHDIEENVFLGIVVMIDERFGGFAGLGEIGERGAEKAPFRKQPRRVPDNGGTAFLKIRGLGSCQLGPR